MNLVQDQKYMHAQHKLKHVALYNSMRELVDDWHSHTGKYEGIHAVEELLGWAREQAQNPTDHQAGDWWGE